MLSNLAVYFLVGIGVALFYQLLLTSNLKGKFYKTAFFIMNLLLWPIVLGAFTIGLINLILTIFINRRKK